MSTLNEGCLQFIGGLFLALIEVLYTAFCFGFVLYKFWYWFLNPAFTTIAPSMHQCMGLLIVYNVFSFRRGCRNKVDKEDFVNAKIAEYIGPWIILLVGYLFKILIIH